MDCNEYQVQAMRTNDGLSDIRLLHWFEVPYADLDIAGIIEGYTGLVGETGELVEIIKKALFQGHGIELDAAKEELGDVLWYIVLICHSFGWSLDEVMQRNIEKLKLRYPEEFSPELSVKRGEVNGAR